MVMSSMRPIWGVLKLIQIVTVMVLQTALRTCLQCLRNLGPGQFAADGPGERAPLATPCQRPRSARLSVSASVECPHPHPLSPPDGDGEELYAADMIDYSVPIRETTTMTP